MNLGYYSPKVKVVGITTPVVDYIPDSEGIVSYCARVSNEDNQTNFETADKLLSYCAKHGHWSVFEMSNAVLELQSPRDISRQVLRHKSAAFQEFCVAEGTHIYTLNNSGGMKKVKVEDLYKRYNSSQYWGNSTNLVRVFDEGTGRFTSAKIKEVFETGVKPVYKVTLENGREITSTKDHKFLSNTGFKRLEDIKEGDFIGCNGDVCYRNYEWMKQSKEEAIKCGGGVQYIADKANISYHTVRKWLKRLGLTFTKNEVAKYTEAWNKGLPTELQPRFGKFHSAGVREKQRKSSRRGENSELYKHGKSISWRKSVAIWSRGYKSELYFKQNKKCAVSGADLDFKDAEVDHIKPVFQHPELAFDVNNLRVISKTEHSKKTEKELLLSRYVPKYSPVKSVEYVGEIQTYDLEVDHDSHNYIANGVVTHNSQRYAEVDDNMFVLREARLQDTKNRQNSIKLEDTCLQEMWKQQQEHVINTAVNAYKWAIDNKIAKECARVVLPEGNTLSKSYMNANMRTWLHYCQLRGGNGTQLEHIWLANACREALKEYFPNLVKIMENKNNGN